MRMWDSAEVRLDIGQVGDGERVGRGGEGWGSSPEHLSPQWYRTRSQPRSEGGGWGRSGREGGGTWLMASG